MRKLTLALILATLSATAAGGEEASLWERFDARVREASAYSFRYDYRGPEGSYRFRYSYAAPGKLKTEILQGSVRGAGTVITYDPGTSPRHVQVHTGLLTIPRRITAGDIEGTSLYIPLYQQLQGKVGERGPDRAATDELDGRPVTRLEFGEDAAGYGFTAYLDGGGDLVRFLERSRGELRKEFLFAEIEWGGARP